MIFVPFHDHQGLGNQVWLLVTGIQISSVLKKKLCLVNSNSFKAKKILQNSVYLDFAFCQLDQIPDNAVLLTDNLFYNRSIGRNVFFDEAIYAVKLYQDCEFLVLVGNWQSESLLPHRDVVSRYISFSSEAGNYYNPADTCILNIRGGDYLGVFSSPAVPIRYWSYAIEYIKSRYRINKFAIVTDDYLYASIILPGIEILKGDIYHDLSCIACAQYLVVSNSSFPVLPIYLSSSIQIALAPYLWARISINNSKYWGSPVNFYSFLSYLDYNIQQQFIIKKKSNQLLLTPDLAIVENSSFQSVLHPVDESPVSRHFPLIKRLLLRCRKSLIYCLVYLKSFVSKTKR